MLLVFCVIDTKRVLRECTIGDGRKMYTFAPSHPTVLSLAMGEIGVSVTQVDFCPRLAFPLSPSIALHPFPSDFGYFAGWEVGGIIVCCFSSFFASSRLLLVYFTSSAFCCLLFVDFCFFLFLFASSSFYLFLLLLLSSSADPMQMTGR